MASNQALPTTAAQTLKALLSAYNRGAAGEAAMLYAADATHEDVAPGRCSRGSEAIRSGLARFLAAFPDAHWEVRRIVGDRASAAAEYLLTGTLAQQLGPFAPSGQALELRGVMLISTVDGCITSSRDFWDSATLQRQLGGGR